MVKGVVEQNEEDCICIIGDFNSVRNCKERAGKGDGTENRDMREFENYIRQWGVVELPLIGKMYTWYRPDGTCKSRLDRMMVNSEWLGKWPDQVLKGLGWSFSDHRPIYIESQAKDWGSRPFRFLNYWISHPTFKEFFEKKWAEYNIEGWSGFILKEKLKLLRQDLKTWNKEVFGIMEEKIAEKKQVIEELDTIDDTFELEEEEVVRRNRVAAELIRCLNWKDSILAQKTKSWTGSGNGVFNTKDAYRGEAMDIVPKWEKSESIAFKRLWKIAAPRSHQAIVWKILNKKMPTRVELQRRGVIPANGEILCPLCGRDDESIEHLFFTCPSTHKVWTGIYAWLGVVTATHYDPRSSEKMIGFNYVGCNYVGNLEIEERAAVQQYQMEWS
ncbi:hypothetical protein ACS0TY_033399 [Phlomoides rotata]